MWLWSPFKASKEVQPAKLLKLETLFVEKLSILKFVLFLSIADKSVNWLLLTYIS